MAGAKRPNQSVTAASSWPGKIQRTSRLWAPTAPLAENSAVTILRSLARRSAGAVPDAAASTPRPIRSDAFEGFQPPGLDRLHELLVVLFVLVGVTLGEVGDRCVERVAVTQVVGNGDRVPGPGVGPRQRPSADARVEREPERCH